MPNLRKLIQQIDSVAEKFAAEKDRIEVKALQAGHIAMINRVFGTGTEGGGTAVDGTPFGEYSETYGRIRRGELSYKGERKVYGLNFRKNLTFNRNLKNSIQIGIKDGKNCIGYTDLDLKQIAEFQETSPKQINKPIFGFDANEQEVVDRIVREEVTKLIEVTLA